MNEKTKKAISLVEESPQSYFKFLSANETGNLEGLQTDIYIDKNASSILFDSPGTKGINKDRQVKINWMGDFETDSQFIYCGTDRKNQYRITNFGKDFPYLKPDYTGALFVLIKESEDYYSAFILDSEDEINDFLEYFSLSPTESNQIINLKPKDSSDLMKNAIINYINPLDTDFPSSNQISQTTREIFNKFYNHENYEILNPDTQLLDWIKMDYSVFKIIEEIQYGPQIKSGFNDMSSFLKTYNTVLHRRKNRAAKSLENQLSAIFDANQLKYSYQSITEGIKSPDFIFPSIEAYGDLSFSEDNLVLLTSKTTCKDSWRQILNEGDRVRDKTKYLFTLQQGISPNQLNEMKAEQVQLIIPKAYINTYPQEFRSQIWTLKDFIQHIKSLNY